MERIREFVGAAVEYVLLVYRSLLKCSRGHLKVHKIEIFFGFDFELFLYKLCQNIMILQKKIFDQAIIGGDTIFLLSLRLSGIEFSLV
jgi:hypothetical protein